MAEKESFLLNEKDSFVLHQEDFAQIDKLSNADAGKLLKAILLYVSTGALPDKLCVRAEIMFDYIRRHLDWDRKKYLEKCKKNSEAGKKGGRPRKHKPSNEDSEKAKKANGFSEKHEKATESKKSLYDIDIDIECDSDSDIESESESEREPDPEREPVARLGAGWQSRTAAPILPPDPQQAQEDVPEWRVRYLRTMLNLCSTGAIVDPEEERRWKRELEELTGGTV